MKARRMLLSFVPSMSMRKIIDTFHRWREVNECLVLATVYETAGSTYSKAGHRILIAENGDYQGLVSGGCLEGDLAERAARVLATREASCVTYDMRDEADDVFGLGVGCDGLIRVLLQPLAREEDFEPFSSISEIASQGRRAATATVVASGDGYELGDTIIWEDGRRAEPPATDPVAQSLLAGCEQAASIAAARVDSPTPGLQVLYAPIRSVPRLLILGAGLDAVPVARMAYELGWQVTVADHRPAYVERGDFGDADELCLVDPHRLAAEIDLSVFDAVLVMSHHLLTDETYLKALSPLAFRYLGVLGPPARREKLLDALGEAGENLRQRLRGPVGLDLGPAESPEAIALSIVAELYAEVQAPARTTQVDAG